MPSRVDTYCDAITSQNINGAVLAMCDMSELKAVLNMSFGDWEIFHMVLSKMRRMGRNAAKQRLLSENIGRYSQNYYNKYSARWVLRPPSVRGVEVAKP